MAELPVLSFALSPLALSLREPAGNPLWVLIVGFLVGAIVVWFAGTKLSRVADVIADRTGIGRAFAGVVLLAGATSLPEIATTVTAAVAGNAALAGNNLIGGIAMQVAVLAVVDVLVLRRGPITFFTPRPALLMQGVMLVLLCCLTAAAISVGDHFMIAGAGLWSIGLAVAYLLVLAIVQQYEGDPRWQPYEPAGEREPGEPEVREGTEARQRQEPDRRTMPMVWLHFGLVSLGVLIGGFIVAHSGDGIAERTGIGSSFVGATLIALTTSLPEVSTTFAAVRMKAYAMAVANIFGSNAICVALLFVSDMFYRGGSVINALGNGSVFMAALGAVLTCVYLWGLLERRDRSLLRGGYDSIAVLVLYLAGLVVFYFAGQG